MNTVPEMISTTDHMYLKEIFKLKFIGAKKAIDFSEKVQDETIKQELTNTAMMYQSHCQKIIELLHMGENNGQ